jgi:hypothetical protein
MYCYTMRICVTSTVRLTKKVSGASWGSYFEMRTWFVSKENVFQHEMHDLTLDGRFCIISRDYDDGSKLLWKSSFQRDMFKHIRKAQSCEAGERE